MTADEIIREVYEKASEWIEMSHNPGALVSRILATEIVKLKSEIEYLERRLKNNVGNSN